MLINESSASASEILGGALHDNQKAVLVGTNSFGKACVQNVKQLEDGSAILITIAKYLTPNGTDITKKGITPDYIVEIPTAEADAALEAQEGQADPVKDLQLNKAVEVMKTIITGTGEMEKIMARRVSAVPIK